MISKAISRRGPRSIHIPCGGKEHPFGSVFQTSATSYAIARRVICEGTCRMGLMKKFSAIVKMAGDATGSIRLYDLTNAQQIAELAAFTNESVEIVETKVLAYVPLGRAILELQIKTSDVLVGAQICEALLSF